MKQKISLVGAVVFPFLTFVMMFLGAGFISGGIVHLGEGANMWDISLLITGILFFIIGSYVQEIIYNKKSLKEGGTVKFLFFSLLLSLGVGMVSGGIQHFVDTPTYSAYLIPIGIFLGVMAYTFKNNISLPRPHWGMLSAFVLLFSLGSWIILSNAALHMKVPQSHHIEVGQQVAEGKQVMTEPTHSH